MSRHGRAKQYGPEPPEGVYTKPPPPVHGNNTYNGRAHHHFQQQHQQQQFYGTQQQLQQQQQPNVVGTRPPSSNHHLHHSLPRNAWSADRHSPAAGGSSSNSSNERIYAVSRRSKHHRVYNSYRQSSARRALHHHKSGGAGGGGGGATTDPDALSSVTTAGVKYGRQQLLQQAHHQSQHQLQQLHQLQQQQNLQNVHRPLHWPSSELPPAVAAPHQLQGGASVTAAAQQYQMQPPLLPPLNSAPIAVNRQPVTTAGLPTAASTGGGGLALRHHQQPVPPTSMLQFPSCDVAVDACGGHCPRFENFCHFCLLVFYFVGITVGFLLILAAAVSSRDPRFMYIGGLVLPVSMFLMAVQCRVRRDANRRKRHRQLLNGRLHHHPRSNAAAITAINGNHGGGVGQPNAVASSVAETIPLQNIMVAGGGGSSEDNATLRRQFHGNMYQYVGQADEESTYDGHHYETASDLQQIEGVPWWRREDNRSYHGRTTHQ